MEIIFIGSMEMLDNRFLQVGLSHKGGETMRVKVRSV